MTRINLAHLGILAAVVALPACGGGGASAPSVAGASSAQLESVRLGTVNASGLRSAVVVPVRQTTSLRSEVVTAPASAPPIPAADPAATAAPAPTRRHASSLRLQGPPGYSSASPSPSPFVR